MYECETCTDTFYRREDVDDHMDDLGHWPECETCARTFCTQGACNQHMNDRGHWAPRFECETCTRDFKTQNAADQHMSAVRHWLPRIPCEICPKRFFTQQAADQHMRDLAHYDCKPCGRRFRSENERRMHQKTHAIKTTECPGCPHMFVSDSAMVLHLEAGTCESGADGDLVDEVAFDCYQSDWYTCDDDADFDFKCPTCDTPFLYMSAVLQHAESGSCRQNLTKGTPLGKFLRYLWARV